MPKLPPAASKVWKPTQPQRSLIVDGATAKLPLKAVAKQAGISALKLRRWQAGLLAVRKEQARRDIVKLSQDDTATSKVRRVLSEPWSRASARLPGFCVSKINNFLERKLRHGH